MEKVMAKAFRAGFHPPPIVPCRADWPVRDELEALSRRRDFGDASVVTWRITPPFRANFSAARTAPSREVEASEPRHPWRGRAIPDCEV